MSPRTIALAIIAVAMLAACSSAPAGSTPPGATQAPVATGTPQATGTPSTTVPGTSPGGLPSFASDPDLAARFPTQVGGQPVTDVTTVLFLEFLHAFGTTDAQIAASREAFTALGIDLDKVVFGSAQASVNGSSVSFQAFRVPGQDAGKLIQDYSLLSPSDTGDTLTQETVGGKNVSVVRSADGYASTWMYANGDIMWSVNTSDQDEAAAVFAALP